MAVEIYQATPSQNTTNEILEPNETSNQEYLEQQARAQQEAHNRFTYRVSMGALFAGCVIYGIVFLVILAKWVLDKPLSKNDQAYITRHHRQDKILKIMLALPVIVVLVILLGGGLLLLSW